MKKVILVALILVGLCYFVACSNNSSSSGTILIVRSSYAESFVG